LEREEANGEMKKVVIPKVFDFTGYEVYKGGDLDFTYRKGW
jgi:hypothetical protein